MLECNEQQVQQETNETNETNEDNEDEQEDIEEDETDFRSFKNQVQKFMAEVNNKIAELVVIISKKVDITSNQSTSNTALNKALPQKHKIPYSVRCKAWTTHIGAEVGQTKCLCCKDNTITQFKFTCGHIISRADGGTLAMENLRPICYDCNNDMGNENMREFAQRIYNVDIV